MTFAVSMRHTMANAKPVADPGLCLKHPYRRAKLIELSRRHIAAEEARKAREAALDKAIERAREHHRRRQSAEAGQTPPNTIIAMVAAWHGLTHDDIVAADRAKELVLARMDAIAAVRLNCRICGSQFSTPRLGRLFKRDHSTILHALRKAGLA